jgi:hypothetical protein
MTPVGWVLAAALVVGVVGLAVVPFVRAKPAETGQEAPRSDVRAAVAAELRAKYCLWCGEPYPTADQTLCGSCGRLREGAEA